MAQVLVYRGSTQARRWCYTLNNPSNEEKDFFRGLTEHDARYGICQLESGEKGTVHLQGYLEFASPKRLSWLKNRFNARAHWEKARGTLHDNKRYCSKEETRLEGPWEFGRLPKQGRRSDLEEIKRDLDRDGNLYSISQNHFGQWVRYHKSFSKYISDRQRKNWRNDSRRRVTVFYGPTGTGKTRAASEICLKKVQDQYFLWGPLQAEWFDGYQGETYVIYDEADKHSLRFGCLLQLLDRYPVQVQVKGGMIFWNAKVIFMTSTKHPSEWYPNKDYSQLERRIDDIYELLNDVTVKHK